ncbi:MAG: hypothetical protein WC372_08210 [Candidatus Neomarinimicrobiota bacterium]|jgi:hypothetical protein
MNILALLFAGEKLGDILEEQARKLTHHRKMAVLRERRGLPLVDYKLLPQVSILLDAERLQQLEDLGARDLLNEMLADGEFLQNGTFPFKEEEG